jgi:hypothetical protein
MSSYEIALFADGAESHAETLRNTIRRGFEDLGIPLGLFAFCDDKTVARRDPKAPTVGVFWGVIGYQEIEGDVIRHPKRQSEMIFLYDASGIRGKWMNRIAWLDRQQVAIKSLRVAQAQSSSGGLR